MCPIYDVLSHFMLFCCKIFLLCDLRCFVAKSVLSWFTHFGVEKNLCQKLCMWRKKDKYEVCKRVWCFSTSKGWSFLSLDENVSECFASRRLNWSFLCLDVSVMHNKSSGCASGGWKRAFLGSMILCNSDNSTLSPRNRAEIWRISA